MFLDLLSSTVKLFLSRVMARLVDAELGSLPAGLLPGSGGDARARDRSVDSVLFIAATTRPFYASRWSVAAVISFNEIFITYRTETNQSINQSIKTLIQVDKPQRDKVK